MRTSRAIVYHIYIPYQFLRQPQKFKCRVGSLTKRTVSTNRNGKIREGKAKKQTEKIWACCARIEPPVSCAGMWGCCTGTAAVIDKQKLDSLKNPPKPTNKGAKSAQKREEAGEKNSYFKVQRIQNAALKRSPPGKPLPWLAIRFMTLCAIDDVGGGGASKK